jgi:chemotaxis-related protein WspD
MKAETKAAAERLLDAEVGTDYLAEEARRYARAKSQTRRGAHCVVIFRLGGEWLALPARVFGEVAPLRPVHSLPHRRDNVVVGLANIRGELLVCVALAPVLGFATEPTTGAGARIAVIGHGDARFVFVADEIAGLHRYDDVDLQPLPATLAQARAVHVRGLLDWNNKPVGVLDDGVLFRSLNRHFA